jgi:hypothetical protein
MNAYQDGVAMAVGQQDALIEVNEAVVMPQHQDAKIPAKLSAHAVRHIEGQVFFALAGVAAHRAGIAAAVAGIEDHCAEAHGARAVPPFIPAGG